MPSGAKKRKAAKKKKENNPNSSAASSTTHSHGDKDVKLNDGGEEAENVVRVEREFTSDKKDGGSSGSSSSSSSSDDESHSVKNSQTEVKIVDSPKVADSLQESVAEAVHTAPIEEAISVVENLPAAASDKISSLVEKVEASSSSLAENPVAPLVESVFTENGEKKMSSTEDKVGALSERVEETVVQSVEKIETISEPKEQEKDDRLTVSFNAPTTTATDDGAECEKGSGVTEPLLPPRPVQRTSWKGCCGLFEVFSGSSS